VFYDFAIKVPANTTEASPLKTTLKLTKGIIHRVEVQFPIGTRALAHCRIKRAGYQVWPTNRGGSFASDGYTIPIDENYELLHEPMGLIAICWNDDDTFPHTIDIRVGLLENKAAIAMLKLMKGMASLLRLVGIKV